MTPFFYYVFIIPLSWLPHWLLYRCSDVFFYLLYFVSRYRRKVVSENIRKSFPERSEVEVEKISRKFYRHMCDLIVESIKGCSISKEEVLRRHRYTNPEVLERYFAEGRSLTILGAHYGNWEWVALSLPQVTSFQTYGIFQRLSDPFMNKVLKVSRERHGMKLIDKKDVAATLRASKADRITMGYIADQSPPRTGRKFWLKFLGQDTAATTGFEHFAKEYDTPVLYLNIAKVRRGYFEGTFYPITDSPKASAEGELVSKFMSKLESIIVAKPEHWLWSHKRWKLKRDDV